VHYWNTKRQGFLPECEGFSFEQCLRIADSGIFCGFCTKGHLFSHVRLNRVPEYALEKQDSRMQTWKNHRSASTEIRNSLFIADIKHP
jgi:aerobic-type carbon monoxide dehydrogenase small subunit (CoxS/CutS family)